MKTAGIKKIEELTFGDALIEIKKNLEVHIEAQSTLALIVRAKYESLKQAGFTEKQAIELCKTAI